MDTMGLSFQHHNPYFFSPGKCGSGRYTYNRITQEAEAERAKTEGSLEHTASSRSI